MSSGVTTQDDCTRVVFEPQTTLYCTKRVWICCNQPVALFLLHHQPQSLPRLRAGLVVAQTSTAQVLDLVEVWFGVAPGCGFGDGSKARTGAKRGRYGRDAVSRGYIVPSYQCVLVGRFLREIGLHQAAIRVSEQGQPGLFDRPGSVARTSTLLSGCHATYLDSTPIDGKPMLHYAETRRYIPVRFSAKCNFV